MQSIRFDLPDAFAPMKMFRAAASSGPGSRNERMLLSVSDRMNIGTRPILAECRYRPPPISRIVPVVYEAASESSHSTPCAISSGVPARCIGMEGLSRASRPGSPFAACSPVSTKPGRDGVHANPFGGHFARQPDGKGVHRTLRRRVVNPLARAAGSGGDARKYSRWRRPNRPAWSTSCARLRARTTWFPRRSPPASRASAAASIFSTRAKPPVMAALLTRARERAPARVRRSRTAAGRRPHAKHRPESPPLAIPRASDRANTSRAAASSFA